MNQRQRNKQEKARNKKRHLQLLSKIGKKFSINGLIFLNHYFIFEMEKNAICHFRVKQIPGWEFGIWIYKDGETKLIGEHIEFVDKFKPSRTYISTKDVDEFIQTLLNIQEDPILYFVDSLTSGDALIDFKEVLDNDGKISYCYGYQCLQTYNPKTKAWDIYQRDESISQETFVQAQYNDWLKDKEEDLEGPIV